MHIETCIYWQIQLYALGSYIRMEQVMKKYLIITNDIHGIGGGQLYTEAKCQYLSNNGWNVFVIYYDLPRRSKVYLKRLKAYEDNIIKELQFPPQFYKNKTVNTLVDNIKMILHFEQEEKVVIESNTITGSIWGELLAQSINAHHLCYILSEQFNINASVMQFLLFKYQYNMLYGTNEHSLKILFSGNGSENNAIEGRYLTAFSEPQIDGEHKNLGVEIDKYDYKIGFLSRLDKHYVIQCIKEICMYAQKHSNSKFIIYFIGGTDKEKELKPFIKLIKMYDNIDFYCTGPVFPIPENYLSEMDVVIATAGSVSVAESVGVPVISICVQNDLPFGIYNYTTLSRRDKTDEERFDNNLGDYLRLVLEEKYCDNHEKIKEFPRWCDCDIDRMEKEFNNQVRIAEACDLQYYDISKISFGIKERILKKIYANYNLRMTYHKMKIFLKG